MKELLISKIETSIQTRYRLDQSVIGEYALAMKAGAKFPPVDVFSEKGSERFILVDGHHRLHAAHDAGRKKLACNVHSGDREAALRFALAANSDHGLRRSQADKRKAVLTALNQPEYEDLSLRDLSEICRVSHELVRNIKQEINEKAEGMDDPEQPVEPKKKNDKRTQDDVDLLELRDFVSFIKAFPYPGEQAGERLKLTDSDKEEIEAVISWLTEAIQ